MTTKNTPVKFTKQKMIEDINSLRKITMEYQYLKSDLGRLFPSLYCYKVVNKLIELGFLKFSQKQAQGTYFKWTFDTKVDLKLVDALFSSVLEYRNFLSKKSLEHRVMRIKKQELIKSQEKANLQVEEPILEPTQEIAKEEKQFTELINLSIREQLLPPDKLAIELGLMPTYEEIQGWKNEIDYLKDELKNKIEALTRQQTANKSYKKRIFETEENLNQSLKIIKIQDNKIQGYENSLNSQKVSAESYKKRFEDTQKSLDEAKKVIKEQEIEIEVLEQKKSFKSIKPKTEPKEVKYFKLFGIKIYEKN